MEKNVSFSVDSALESCTGKYSRTRILILYLFFIVFSLNIKFIFFMLDRKYVYSLKIQMCIFFFIRKACRIFFWKIESTRRPHQNEPKPNPRHPKHERFKVNPTCNEISQHQHAQHRQPQVRIKLAYVTRYRTIDCATPSGQELDVPNPFLHPVRAEC